MVIEYKKTTEEVFAEIIARIPATWRCLKCQQDFDNTPDSVPPYACEYCYDPVTDKVTKNYICLKCFIK